MNKFLAMMLSTIVVLVSSNGLSATINCDLDESSDSGFFERNDTLGLESTAIFNCKEKDGFYRIEMTGVGLGVFATVAQGLLFQCPGSSNVEGDYVGVDGKLAVIGGGHLALVVEKASWAPCYLAGLNFISAGVSLTAIHKMSVFKTNSSLTDEIE
jgi:hypothetical protein